MKASRWFAASLALNVALAAACFTMATRPDEAGRRDLSATRATRPQANANAAAGSSQPAQSSGPQGTVAALRAAGVAEPLVARVAAVEFERRWWAQHRELQQRVTRGEADDAELAERAERRDAEEEAAMREALGEAGFAQWHREKLLDEFDRAALRLSTGEADAAYQLRVRLNAHVRQLQASRREGLLDEAEFVAHATASQASYDQQLRALLGETRYGALHPDDESNRGALRADLRRSGASAESSSAVLAAEERWNQQRTSLESELQQGRIDGAAYEAAVKGISAQRDEAFRATLGEDGIAALQRARDPRFNTLQRFAGAWELSERDLTAVYQMLRDGDRAVQEARPAPPANSPAAERNAVAARERVEARLRAYLGAARFERMRRVGVLNIGD